MAAAAAEPSPVEKALEAGTIHWVSDPRYLVCPAGHVQRLRDTGIHRDGSGMSGHDFLRCDRCRPSSHWFAVFVRQPSPTVFNYLIAEACWREWHGRAGDTPETLQMLNLIYDHVGRNYNPQFRTSPHG